MLRRVISVFKTSRLKFLLLFLITVTVLKLSPQRLGPAYYPRVPEEIREPATNLYLTKYGVSHWRPEKVKKIQTWTPLFGTQGWAKSINEQLKSCRNLHGACHATNNKSELHSSSAVLFHADDFWITWFTSFSNSWKPNYRDPSQIWVFMAHEATPSMWGWVPAFWFNWTMTYRRDSTIVSTYGLHEMKTPQELLNSAEESLNKINYFEKKTKMAVIHVSNCADYGRRYKIIRELSQYLDVDEYGHCSGKVICNSTVPYWKCLEFFKPYKFYLAFENAMCRDNVTEKYTEAQLFKFQIPVLAASNVTLELLPPKSYLNVFDFPSIKDLADEMIRVGSNANLYNSFFEWRKYYKPPINPYCNLCNALHENRTAQSYHDMEAWFKHDTCSTPTEWRFIKSMLGNPAEFLNKTSTVDPEKVPKDAALKARDMLKDVNGDMVKKVCHACHGIHVWNLSVIDAVL